MTDRTARILIEVDADGPVTCALTRHAENADNKEEKVVKVQQEFKKVNRSAVMQTAHLLACGLGVPDGVPRL